MSEPHASSAAAAGPLADLRVIDMSTVLAGPNCARYLADFGADVIKVERPDSGDSLRNMAWRDPRDGEGLWWKLVNRNKRTVALDLKLPDDLQVLHDLLADAHVLVENFRPGTLEGWGLGYDDLVGGNPGLVMVRISGYGQTGPYRERPGFGVIGEAVGGLRYVTGTPDRPPSRVGVSIGDTLSALYGVIGALVALESRRATGRGQVVDVALYEAVFNCMESLLPEYSAFGAVRQPAGSALPGIAPSNAYRCRDGGYALIAGNGDSIFKRLTAVMGRDDLGNNPAMADNAGRVARIRGPVSAKCRARIIGGCPRNRRRNSGPGRALRAARPMSSWPVRWRCTTCSCASALPTWPTRCAWARPSWPWARSRSSGTSTPTGASCTWRPRPTSIPIGPRNCATSRPRSGA